MSPSGSGAARAGYSAAPLWKKLGAREGTRLTLIGAPRGWSVPELPAGARQVRERPVPAREDHAELIVAFFGQLAQIEARLGALGLRIFPDGSLWAAWPRRAGGHDSDVRDGDVRSLALALGLVDVKVAALDPDWSALKLVWRRELRHAPPATHG